MLRTLLLQPVPQPLLPRVATSSTGRLRRLRHCASYVAGPSSTLRQGRQHLRVSGEPQPLTAPLLCYVGHGTAPQAVATASFLGAPPLGLGPSDGSPFTASDSAAAAVVPLAVGTLSSTWRQTATLSAGCTLKY